MLLRSSSSDVTCYHRSRIGADQTQGCALEHTRTTTAALRRKAFGVDIHIPISGGDHVALVHVEAPGFALPNGPEGPEEHSRTLVVTYPRRRARRNSEVQVPAFAARRAVLPDSLYNV